MSDAPAPENPARRTGFFNAFIHFRVDRETRFELNDVLKQKRMTEADFMRGALAEALIRERKKKKSP